MTQTPAPSSSVSTGEHARRYRGQVVYLYAFDMAYDMKREPITTLLGQPVTTYAPLQDKRSPRELFFHQPRVVRLPEARWETPWGDAAVQRTVKLFAVGALSVSVCVPYEVGSLAELVSLHEFGMAHEEASRIAERVLEELRPSLIRPTAALRDEEAYIAFCLDWPMSRGEHGGGDTAETWLGRHQREVAALLMQEEDAAALAEQEIRETVEQRLSYYTHDLAVIDWDAALLVDRPGQFNDTLHVIELANVQLAELTAYDTLLDRALQPAYDNLRGIRARPGRAIKALRELRIDMARLNDELNNTTKFFGDWHLARIYQALSRRFHLGDWQETVNGKLRTLDDLYRLVRQDQMNFWMMVLEATIVVLFLIDLALIVFLGK